MGCVYERLETIIRTVILNRFFTIKENRKTKGDVGVKKSDGIFLLGDSRTGLCVDETHAGEKR